MSTNEAQAAEPTPMATGSNDSSALRHAVALIFVFVLAVAVYAPALEGPFLWDDEALIEREEVATLKPLSFYFSRPFWLATDTQGSPQFYRPLTVLTLALDHTLHGENSAGFHLTNLLLHGLSAALVLALGRRLGATPAAALVGALLFAWFPRLSEAAAWISGRTDLLATAFSLAALRVTLGAGPRRTWISSALLLAGLLSKEVAFAAALAVAWYEWQASRAAPPQARLQRLLPLLMTGGVYAILRFRVLGDAPSEMELRPGQLLTAPSEALGRYAAMLLDGWHPRLNIGSRAFPAWPYVALGVAVGTAIAFALFRWRPEPRRSLLLLTGGCALAVVLHLLPYPTPVAAADRFLYLPIAAFAPVLASLLDGPRGRLARGIAAALALSYLPFTWQRAALWGDDIVFWSVAVREQDHRYNALSHTGLGSILVRHGMYEEALSVYQRTQPGDRGTFLLAVEQHATVLAMNGDTDGALQVLEQGAAVHPSPRLSKTLALSYAGVGKIEMARSAAKRFASQVQDRLEVAELWQTLATLERRHEALAAPGLGTARGGQPVSLHQRIAAARSLADAQRFRVAMNEFMTSIDDPAMTARELRAILLFSLSYGTPRQVNRVYERLLALDPTTPTEFSLVVAERNLRIERLRKVCRELRIPVVN